MLDELLVGGEIQETSKKNIIRAVTAQDMLQEVRALVVILSEAVRVLIRVCGTSTTEWCSTLGHSAA